MAGRPAFVKEASPNLNFTFQPHPQYWVAFGNFEEGTVIDINTVTNSENIIYAVNIYLQTAILEADNTWTVQSNQQRNSTFRMLHKMSNVNAPFYKCRDCGHIWGSSFQPTTCPNCGGTRICENI